MQLPGEEAGWSSERAGKEMTVPAVASLTPSGTRLLVLQARAAETVEDLLDGEGAGRLLSPATVDGVEETGTARVISGVFLTEEPPTLVLVTAGAWLLLAERGSWPEGRWLAVDLATALERRGTKAAGELETIAALVSGDTLLPGDDGNPAWQGDLWTREIPSPPIGELTPQWTMTIPLRRDAERRQALVEIDALAAVMLGITAEELCAIYRTQFGVLRKYERVMQFDANGRQVPKEVLKDIERLGSRADLGRYELPFIGVDREAEMSIAHAEFTRRLAGR